MSLRYRRHTLDIYGTHLRHATDLTQWRDLRREVDSLAQEPAGLGLAELALDTESRNAVTVAIYTDTTGTELDAMRTCVHEAAHAAGMILNHAGDAVDGESEAFAYLVEWLAAWLWEGVARHFP